MALVIENGTGGNAMVSLQGFRDYAELMGWDIDNYDDDDLERAIKRGANYILNNYNFQGFKVGGRTQLLPFPRSGMIDPEGLGYSYTVIPVEASNANCEAAWYDLNNEGGLTPTVVLNDMVKSETVGPLSVEYLNHGEGVSALRPTIYAIDDWLKPLLATESSPFTARADRG